jgi:hypothetical protein
MRQPPVGSGFYRLRTDIGIMDGFCQGAANLLPGEPVLIRVRIFGPQKNWTSPHNRTPTGNVYPTPSVCTKFTPASLFGSTLKTKRTAHSKTSTPKCSFHPLRT